MKFCLPQRGDTIVEVVIAFSILGVVIASSYSVANRATRIAQALRDRFEATQLIQQQVEGLRWIRDNEGWTALLDQLKAGGSNPDSFYVEASSGNWAISKVSPGGSACDPLGVSSCVTERYYTYSIIPLSSAVITSSTDSIPFKAEITWTRLGGGTDRSVIYSEIVRVD